MPVMVSSDAGAFTPISIPVVYIPVKAVRCKSSVFQLS